MTGKLRRNIGFTLMPFAFLFLFDPSYALLDPLPDFFGYFILCLALINLADVNPKIMEAFVKFRAAVILSIAQFASMFMIESLFEGQEKAVISLVFIFVFAVFDAVILIPAYKNFFEGLLYLGTYHDGTAIYECKKEGKPNISERMFALCVVVTIAKELFWVLPELTTLISNSTYEFVNVLRLFAACIIVPITIFWLIKMLVYIKKIKRDVVFIDNLKAFYLEKTNNAEDFFTCRVISIGLITFTVAFVLSFDLFLDNTNIISDVWQYIALILGALLIKRYSKKWISIIIISVLGVVSAVFCDVASSYFFSRYIPENIIKDLDAYNAYYFMLSIYIVEAVVFCSVLAVSLLFMFDVYSKHTDMSSDKKSAEYKYMNRRFKIGSALVMCCGALSALAGVYYFGSLPYSDKSIIFEISGVLSRAICLVFVFASWYFIGYIKSSVKQHSKAYLY